MSDISVNYYGLVSGIDPQDVYVDKGLYWTKPNDTSASKQTEDIWKWLLDRAATSQEKAEVLAEKAYIQDHPEDHNALGNGIDKNTLYGWALMGVDPFNHRGGQADDLKNAVSNAVSLATSGQNGYEKDPHVRKANELLRQTHVMMRIAYERHSRIAVEKDQ